MYVKYILGSQGQIGKFCLSKTHGWEGINRKTFYSWLCNIEQLEEEIKIINMASLSVSDQIRLIRSLNKRKNYTELLHFSSISALNKKPSAYSTRKLNEERIFAELLEKQVNYKNIRIGIPLGCNEGKWISFGYWSNVKLDKKSIVITTKNITFDLLDVLIDQNISPSYALELENFVNRNVFRILPNGKLVQRLPIRRINSILGKIGLYLLR